MTLEVQHMRDQIRHRFESAGVAIAEIDVKSYPEETIWIVYVADGDLPRAATLGNELDAAITEAGLRGFIAVRKAQDEELASSSAPLTKGVHDTRATELIRLISARSRTSEGQPSLSYVPDSAAGLAAATAPRHNLIFGRRGAGKTALMLEAKKAVANEGHLTLWANLQTYRHDPVDRIYLRIAGLIVDLARSGQPSDITSSRVSGLATDLSARIDSLLLDDETKDKVQRLIPEIHRLVQRYLELTGRRLYIFLDDFYFIPRNDQAQLLDYLHATTRDTNVWLKVASIKHLTRWFQANPPTGLQTGHDAYLLEVDVTLQDPARAKHFLEDVLLKYAQQVGVKSLTAILSETALDRLVLASGAVPRDYLTLCGSAISKAQGRAKGRLVGVQDVNQAAGDAANVKIRELEDDLAANVGSADQTLAALTVLRSFCLEETRYTYFRIDFRDKEQNPDLYNVMIGLTELRLSHLVDPSVSAAHAAGERFEAYMLDLSQFSGYRLKRNLTVLDFEAGKMVSKKTRAVGAPRIGDTPRALTTILRTSPQFALGRFEGVRALGA